MKREQANQVFNCECMKCGWTTKSSEHCRTLVCEKCGGKMRRLERPGPGQEGHQELSRGIEFDTSQPFDELQQVPVIIRRIFNYRLDLINEWREYYIEGLKKADARVWAWFRFESKYERSKQGRWREKKE